MVSPNPTSSAVLSPCAFICLSTADVVAPAICAIACNASSAPDIPNIPACATPLAKSLFKILLAFLAELKNSSCVISPALNEFIRSGSAPWDSTLSILVASVIGTPNATCSFNSCANPGLVFSNAALSSLILSAWSLFMPAKVAWNVPLTADALFCSSNSLTLTPVSLLNLARFLAYSTVWLTRSRCLIESAWPVALCISNCVERNSDVSSRFNPNSASSSRVLVLNALVKPCMVGIPSMILPNNLAKVWELVCMRSTKSSIGMLADVAAFLKLITDLPNPAPVCESVLNMPTLKSKESPRSESLMPSSCKPSKPLSASPNPSIFLSARPKFLAVFTKPAPSSLRLPLVASPNESAKESNLVVALPIALVLFLVALVFLTSALYVSWVILPSFFSTSKNLRLCSFICFWYSASPLLPLSKILKVDWRTRERPLSSSPKSFSIRSNSSAIRF